MNKPIQANVSLLTRLGKSADARRYHASIFRKVIKEHYPEDVGTKEYEDALSQASNGDNDLYRITSVYSDYILSKCHIHDDSPLTMMG